MTVEPLRVQCPHAVPCGGCPAIALDYDAQLARKAMRLAAACAHFAELAAARPDGVQAATPIAGYRTRAKLVVGARGRLGLYRPGAHEVVDIPECRVLAPVLVEAAAGLRGLCAAPPAAADGVLVAVADGGTLRAVDLREILDGGGARVLATLVLEVHQAVSHEALGAAADAWMERCPALIAVAWSAHDGRSPQLLGRDLKVIRGASTFPDRDAPDEPFLLATHGAFAQAHRGQAVAIRRRVREAVRAAGAERILELYAGSGALGLALAKDGRDVTLVESFAPALERAREAADAQALRVATRIGDAAVVAPSLAKRPERFDAVIVNPPRRGLAPAVRDALGDLAPRLVAYVSCDPETLCRDLAVLARRGLAARRLTPFDMIPLTDEVETLALLEPHPPPAPRVLFADDEVVVVDKDPHEPTTPQGERSTSLLGRVRSLPGCAEAVPVHRLDDSTSGVCIFARSPNVVAPWAKALGAEGATKEYLGLVRGVARDKGSIARPLLERGRRLDARTRYRRERVVGGHSLVHVRPDEGRRHQIRRHLAAIGHPLLGDARYGHAPSNRHFVERWALDRVFLHCARIELVHPRTGARLAIAAPLAGDLAIVLARLDASDARRGE